MHEAWREAVWELFTTCELEGPAGTTTRLADVLAHVLGTPSSPAASVTLERCPGRHDRDCGAAGLVVPLTARVRGVRDRAATSPTRTNTHDEVVELGSNDNALGRLMPVLELLTFLWQIASSRRSTPAASSRGAPSCSTGRSPCSADPQGSSGTHCGSSRPSTPRRWPPDGRAACRHRRSKRPARSPSTPSTSASHPPGYLLCCRTATFASTSSTATAPCLRIRHRLRATVHLPGTRRKNPRLGHWPVPIRRPHRRRPHRRARPLPQPGHRRLASLTEVGHHALPQRGSPRRIRT